ncbi:MAG TPA: hypothetical protein ENL29_01735 [Thermoplasmatales archaeon]|nr:MAG: hypothetical protein DRN10_00180 [Thermoplasmata archaeon]RLF63882.1 MAG: hypothetical protein DRN31_01470 [Thermoplasmata archaeon]HHH84169.1 hypothetical protein [Thermoplasmatales archaeon]
MDVISLIVGFVVGIIAVSIAIELSWKKEEVVETCKIAKRWSISEISNPMIVAEKLKMNVPGNAKVVVKVETAFSKGAKVNPDAYGNFILGSNKALIFSGEIREGQLALRTVDGRILRKLRELFNEFWEGKEEEAAPEKSHRKGTVTVRGLAKAVVPYRENYLIRLSYDKGLIGVLIDEKMELEGRKIEVEGEMVGDERPFIKAYHIEILE